MREAAPSINEGWNNPDVIEKTNNNGLEEWIGVGRICQKLVQAEEHALCGFGAFGEVINLSLIRCIPKAKDKRSMNILVVETHTLISP